MRVSIDGITFHETHFAEMKKEDAIKAIVIEAEGAGIEIGKSDKDKKLWAEKVFGLMVKKESPEK